MSTSSDSITALKALAAADRNARPSNEEIANATGLDPESLNDAVDLLENRGWANVTRTLSNAPFNFLSAAITAEGRLTLEQLSASAVESVKGIAVDDWGAPSSKWDEVEIRLQALKDELRTSKGAEDWRDVGNRARLLIIDAINVAFDGSMVREGQTAPKLDDAKSRIDLYLQARAPGTAVLESIGPLRLPPSSLLNARNADAHPAHTNRAAHSAHVHSPVGTWYPILR